MSEKKLCSNGNFILQYLKICDYGGGVNRTDDLRVNCTDDLRVSGTWRFQVGGGKSFRQFEGKSYRQFEGKSDLVNWGGGAGRAGINHTDNLRVNRTDDLKVSQTWQFRGGGKSSNIFHQVNTFHLLS